MQVVIIIIALISSKECHSQLRTYFCPVLYIVNHFSKGPVAIYQNNCTPKKRNYLAFPSTFECRHIADTETRRVKILS